jgi:hypothetical protein
MVLISPTANSIANVTGSATLTGATVQAVFASGTFMANTYTILHTTGGLSGTFNTTVNNTNLQSGFTETVTNVGNDVKLNLTAALGGGNGGNGNGGNGNGGNGGGSGGSSGSSNSIPGNGLNPNQQHVANAINTFFNNGGALPPPFVPLFSLTGGNLSSALSQLTGENATGAQHSANALMGGFLNLVLDPFVYGGGTPGGVSAVAHGFAPERQALPDDLALAYAQALKGCTGHQGATSVRAASAGRAPRAAMRRWAAIISPRAPAAPRRVRTITSPATR